MGRLRELGWIEGRTVAIEYRFSEGRPERVPEIAAEFARLKVDVIVAYGGAVTTLKQSTAAIPIVFALASDPIGSGLVASLYAPGRQCHWIVTSRRPILPASGSNFCVSLSPVCAGWQSCLMPAISHP